MSEAVKNKTSLVDNNKLVIILYKQTTCERLIITKNKTNIEPRHFNYNIIIIIIIQSAGQITTEQAGRRLDLRA